jgi:hypothetical protein
MPEHTGQPIMVEGISHLTLFTSVVVMLLPTDETDSRNKLVDVTERPVWAQVEIPGTFHM